MNRVELEAARRLLLIPRSEASELISGTKEQAWSRWESGVRQKIPGDVIQKMQALLSDRQVQIANAIREANDQRAVGETPVMIWYESIEDFPGTDDVLQLRLYWSVCGEMFDKHGVRLAPFDREAFEAWADKKGKPDTTANRLQWARTQL